MNLTRIQYERPEVWKLIMERWPLSKDERRGCQTEKAMRDACRLEMGKKIIANDVKEKREYGNTVRDN